VDDDRTEQCWEASERAAEITHVSADMADWIAKTVAARAPNAIRFADPFHVVVWAIEALDVERRRAWNQASGHKITASPGRRGRTTDDSRKIARSRYALWKNPDDLNGRQRQQLEWIAKTDPKLWRAYLLKEGLRYVFAVKPTPLLNRPIHSYLPPVPRLVEGGSLRCTS
jgi:transposase